MKLTQLPMVHNRDAVLDEMGEANERNIACTVAKHIPLAWQSEFSMGHGSGLKLMRTLGLTNAQTTKSSAVLHTLP